MLNSSEKLESVVDSVRSVTGNLEKHAASIAEESVKLPEYLGAIEGKLVDRIESFQRRSDVATASAPPGIDFDINNGSALALYALGVSKKTGIAIESDELKSVITPYFSGIFFGFFSALKAFSPKGIRVDLAGASVFARDLGDVDMATLISRDFSNEKYIIRKAKWAIDKQVGLATDEDMPADNEEAEDQPAGAE